MSDGPEWFAPKRYGYGTGLPISWQGWAVLILFTAAALALAIAFSTRPKQLIASMIPLVTLFLVVCARTTKGGWRWRWGEEE